MKLVKMTTLVRRVALASLLMALPFAGGASAQSAPPEPDPEDAPYSVEALGDTVLEALGDDQLLAYSARAAPTVRYAGQTVRILIQAADASTASLSVKELGFSVEVERSEEGVTVTGTSGTFTLSFNGQTTSPFDGRFLTAQDLSRDQDYRPRASWSKGASFEYQLFRGGVRVAGFDSEGVAPFVLDRVPDAFEAGARELPNGGQQLEVHTFVFEGATATSDSGESFAVDTIEVHAHELGHIASLRHYDTHSKTVWVSGLQKVLLEVETE